MPKHRLSRVTEQKVMNPFDRVDTSFIPPYGKVPRIIKNRLAEEERINRRAQANQEAEMLFGWMNKYIPASSAPPKPEKVDDFDDMEIATQGGKYKNERHSRIMEKDYLFPHERSFPETNEPNYDQQVYWVEFQKEQRKNLAASGLLWLDKYVSGQDEVCLGEPFEEIDFSDLFE